MRLSFLGLADGSARLRQVAFEPSALGVRFVAGDDGRFGRTPLLARLALYCRQLFDPRACRDRLGLSALRLGCRSCRLGSQLGQLQIEIRQRPTLAFARVDGRLRAFVRGL
jgi:hypothetical protein